MATVTCALFVRLAAKPDRAEEVAHLLRDALPLVRLEPDTTAWFAVRFGPAEFAIFDAFPHEAGRRAHLAGRVAAALLDRAPDLLAEPPSIEFCDVLGAKPFGS